MPAPRFLIAWLIAFATLVTTPAWGQSFPAFEGLVTDAAHILPPDRKTALEQQLEAFQQRTSRQLVVATIPDLNGDDIADYGYKLGRSWGVGLKGADNGAILIVAPKDHRVRIEVGRGLEGVLTDAYSSVIINTKITPAFKAGDMPGGIQSGAAALIEVLSLPDADSQAKQAAAVAQYDKAHKHKTGGVPIALIFWLIVLAWIIGGSLFGRRRYGQRYGGSNWPILLWAASDLLGSRNAGGWNGGSETSDRGGGWNDGGFTGGGGGDFGGGGASGSW